MARSYRRRTLRVGFIGTVAGMFVTSVVGPVVGPVVGAVAGTVAAAAAMQGPGSGGDPYFPLDGNRGYDVAHYRILDDYRPSTDRLTGKTVLTATAYQDLRRFNLDMALKVDKVRVDGTRASYSKPNDHELKIIPDKVVPEGSSFKVVVKYHGRPASTRSSGLFAFFNQGGEGLAVGEPQIGPWWFAANETPADKATYDITVRVPRGQQAISNGELVEKRAEGRWTAWQWEMTDPMVTYLAFFAAGDYRIEKGVTPAGRPELYAVSERLSAAKQENALTLLRQTPDIVSWLEDQFGDYPFTSVGGVVTGTSLGFALENQSRPVYPYVGGISRYSTSLMVHELAHQWFGDDVAVRRWSDIWLNEGFASYAEWLYAESHGGPSVGEELLDQYDGYGAGSGFWDVQVSDPGENNVFSWSIYQRGAMTLAALRERVGAGDLEQILRTWVQRNHDGHGTSVQFEVLAEEISGENLEGFFTHWLDDTSKPAQTQENGLA